MIQSAPRLFASTALLVWVVALLTCSASFYHTWRTPTRFAKKPLPVPLLKLSLGDAASLYTTLADRALQRTLRVFAIKRRYILFFVTQTAIPWYTFLLLFPFSCQTRVHFLSTTSATTLFACVASKRRLLFQGGYRRSFQSVSRLVASSHHLAFWVVALLTCSAAFNHTRGTSARLPNKPLR